jgi:hypothetical protein
MEVCHGRMPQLRGILDWAQIEVKMRFLEFVTIIKPQPLPKTALIGSNDDTGRGLFCR